MINEKRCTDNFKQYNTSVSGVVSLFLFFYLGQGGVCSKKVENHWYKRLVVFESDEGTSLRHTLQGKFFWSVSDFSNPNHVNAIEVGPLFGTSSLSLGWSSESFSCSELSRSLSSMFVCVSFMCRVEECKASSK